MPQPQPQQQQPPPPPLLASKPGGDHSHAYLLSANSPDPATYYMDSGSDAPASAYFAKDLADEGLGQQSKKSANSSAQRIDSCATSISRFWPPICTILNPDLTCLDGPTGPLA